MARKLSISQVKMYSECGKKYEYHYVKNLRDKKTWSYFLFGSALDNALNELLVNKDLNKAQSKYIECWEKAPINGKDINLEDSLLIRYMDSDFDTDVILDHDIKKLQKISGYSDLNKLGDEVKTQKFENCPENIQLAYNKACWLSLKEKGLLMLKSYHEDVLPQFKDILAVQKQIDLIDESGNEMIGYVDFIVEMYNGKRLLLDNKTAGRPYLKDSVKKSQQLVLYYMACKDEYKLDGTGFVVMLKKLAKKTIKVCSKCGHNGSEGRHKTCSNEIEGVRCGAEWIQTSNFTVDIQFITDTIDSNSEDLVSETVQDVNQGIQLGFYPRNLSACDRCIYKNLCWNKDDSELLAK